MQTKTLIALQKARLALEILAAMQDAIDEADLGDAKKYATRKIEAARKSGTLEAAIRAGDDIVWMIENKISP